MRHHSSVGSQFAGLVDTTDNVTLTAHAHVHSLKP